MEFPWAVARQYPVLLQIVACTFELQAGVVVITTQKSLGHFTEVKMHSSACCTDSERLKLLDEGHSAS